MMLGYLGILVQAKTCLTIYILDLISKPDRDLIYQKNNNNWKSFVVVLLVLFGLV